MREPLSVPYFARLSDYAGLWAIDPTSANALWSKASSTDLPAHIQQADPPRIKAELQTVKASNGSTVAVVMLTGTLMKSVSSMGGGTSTVQARREIRKAVSDPDVSAIMLAIDSPGGTVAGTADLAQEIRQAADKKPVWSFVSDMGASAAYWIASQADKVFANNRTALIGSIGTLAVVYDMSAAAEQAGIKTLVFGTGPLKGAGAPGAPVTEEQQAYFRGLVEDAQISFDAAVKRGREMTDSQLEKAKTGGVFGASEALDRGLIDGITSFDSAIDALAAEAKRMKRNSQVRATSPVPVRSVKVDENLTAAGAVEADATLSVDTAIAQHRSQLAAELKRVAGIQRVAKDFPDIAADAIDKGWTADQTELAVLKASLANRVHAANPIHNGGPRFVFGAGKYERGKNTVGADADLSQVLEATLLTSLGRNDLEKQYKPEVLEAAHENFKGYGLQQMLLTAAAHNGYTSHPGERITNGNLRAVLRAAFSGADFRTASTGTSQISMSGILGNVANKEILAGYVEDDMTWQSIASIRPVSNFQQYTSYRMLDDMEYEQLPPDGKIRHGTAGQESYTRQAYTYAKMFLLNRTSIINDDLGAFQDLRTRLGRGSSKKFNKVFWTAFLDNASFFTSGLTNYISGSTTNLGTDGVGLGLGVKAFRTMTSPSADGTKRVNADTQNPVGSSPGGRPEILLVPPSLEGAAEVLYRNQNLGMVSNATANIYAGKYRPVVAWQLEDTGYTGYSATAWYLLNNPNYLAPMVVSFLNGMMAPTVESADADFDTLGIQFRGYHDFGCDKSEYLAGIKSKGAA